jgi:hypothetical protein
MGLILLRSLQKFVHVLMFSRWMYRELISLKIFFDLWLMTLLRTIRNLPGSDPIKSSTPCSLQLRMPTVLAIQEGSSFSWSSWEGRLSDSLWAYILPRFPVGLRALREWPSQHGILPNLEPARCWATSKNVTVLKNQYPTYCPPSIGR